MKVQQMKMKELYKQLRDEIKSKLENHEDLQEVNEVTYGNKGNIKNFNGTVIWILPESHQVELVSGNREQHDFTFELVALIRDQFPDDGMERAQNLAMDIYDVMMEDRQLNKIVHDIRPQNITPSFSGGENNPQLYWSAVQLVFRTQRR